MKKVFPYIFCFVFLIIASVIFFNVGMQRVGNTDNVNVTKEPVYISLTEYYVPVSSYSEMRRGLSLVELKQAKLCALTGNEANLAEILPDVTITYISETEISASLKSGMVCLLAPNFVDIKYKTLALDNVYFWAKESDLTNYPLKKTHQELESASTLATTKETAMFIDSINRSRIFASGEIIPARAVDRLSLNKNNNYTYMFDYFKDDISSADLAIALLENPINGNPSPCTGCMAFVGDEKNALGLKTVGYDMLSLAGNHAGDGAQSGYKRTIEILTEQGIPTTGTGNSDAMKLKPAIYEVNGKRIGMIASDSAASYYWNKGTNYYGTNWFATSMNAGIDEARVKQVAELKATDNIDYLIAYMSWGVEYTNKATDFQTTLAHKLIDNGVDMIISSHPHWVQNIEIYNGKPIFYALGNFVFDQNHTDATREGVNLNLYYVGLELKGIEIMPHLACGPFVSNNDLTNKYLSGSIDRNYLDTHDEKQGCVYFQPKKLTLSNSHYKSIWNRLLQYSDIIK